MKKFIILLMSLSLLTMYSCRVKEGEAGLPGESALNKNGSVTGTVYYKMPNGIDTAIVPFTFEYYPSAQDNEFYYDSTNTQTYSVDLFRREAKEENSYFSINIPFGADLDALKGPAEPSQMYIYFSITENINGKIFTFSNNSNYFTTTTDQTQSRYTISNFSLNTTTGRLQYDFEVFIKSNDIESKYQVDNVTDARVKGKVDVTLNRSGYYVNNL